HSPAPRRRVQSLAFALGRDTKRPPQVILSARREVRGDPKIPILRPLRGSRRAACSGRRLGCEGSQAAGRSELVHEVFEEAPGSPGQPRRRLQRAFWEGRFKRLVRTSAAICPLKESGSQRRAPERSRARRQPARAGQSRGRSRLAARSGWTPSQTRKKIRGPVDRGTGWGASQQPREGLRTQRARGPMGLSEGAAEIGERGCCWPRCPQGRVK